ncbi:MAG TPA: sugar ABC transporter substrate-binding protein [Candidatus Kryptonia bacterium]|nr:sugar ABC transporter substrate-binding protein [Candidatus Kryptonia bacterium]
MFFLSLSCRAAPDGRVVLNYWAMGREGEVVQALVPAFEQREPGIRVRVQQIPWSAAHEKLLTAFVGDAMPDVFQLGNTWIPELVALRAIEPLDQRIGHSEAVHLDDYFGGIVDPNVIDGVVYGLPWYVDTRLIFYRSDILRRAGYGEPPNDWSGWLDAMTRALHQRGGDGYAILLPTEEWQPLVILAREYGADLLRDHDQYGDFRSASFRRAFEFYLDFFRRRLAPRAGDEQVANVYQDFARGYFFVYITGPWNLGEFSRRLPASMADEWSVVTMPALDKRPSTPGVSVAGGASLAIARGSIHKDAAWKWVEYLSEPQQQVAFYRASGDLPPRRSTWDDPVLARDQRALMFARQLSHVQSTPKVPEWERIASKISQYAEAAVRGTMTTDAALAALDHDVDQLLEKRRWMLRRSARSGGHPDVRP